MEKQKTKQRILDAALELFSTQGFEATSIAQIADAVGVRKASLYSHFDSKQDILDRLKAKGIDAYYFPTGETFDGIEKFLLKNCIDGDLLITMGAGNILEVGEHLLGQ